MKHLPRTAVSYVLSRQAPPALRVRPGEAFRLQTEDCYSGRLRSAADRYTKAVQKLPNPATGPVFVAGVQPGQTLRLDVLRITCVSPATMHLGPGPVGVRPYLKTEEVALYPIVRGRLLAEGRAIALRPMIGVIGVAPAGKGIPTVTPGEHGGNMDCKEIKPGCSLYLPVAAPGALVFAGDVHALQGDGEVCVCGAEVRAEVVLRARAVKTRLPTPCVEVDGKLHFLASARTLDECEALVMEKAFRYLTTVRKYRPLAAARLMSLVGELGVCQVVDPLKTMRFTVPKGL